MILLIFKLCVTADSKLKTNNSIINSVIKYQKYNYKLNCTLFVIIYFFKKVFVYILLEFFIKILEYTTKITLMVFCTTEFSIKILDFTFGILTNKFKYLKYMLLQIIIHESTGYIWLLRIAEYRFQT